MGSIHRPLNLTNVFKTYGIKNVVETGTGVGTSIKHLCEHYSHLQLKIYSVELMEELYKLNTDQFYHHSNVNIIQGYSDKKLEELSDIISPEPTLFWLDAHYPGADFNLNGATYTSESNLDIRLPLHKELIAITTSKRNISNDVFILDDLRIYKDGPFTNGNCDRYTIGANGNQFVFDLLPPTHKIVESYLDEGYVVALPAAMTITLEQYNSLWNNNDWVRHDSYN